MQQTQLKPQPLNSDEIESRGIDVLQMRSIGKSKGDIWKPGEGKVEVRLFFLRLDDQIVVEYVYLRTDKHQHQSKLLETILWVWGASEDFDEVTFLMAQDNQSRIIASKPTLLMFIDANKALYGA